MIPADEILTFPSTDLPGIWLACWSRYDLISQGESEQGAIDSLQEAYEMMVDWHEGGGPVFDRAPPADELNEWRVLHAMAHRWVPA